MNLVTISQGPWSDIFSALLFTRIQDDTKHSGADEVELSFDHTEPGDGTDSGYKIRSASQAAK
jgi:hypothetical protein